MKTSFLGKPQTMQARHLLQFYIQNVIGILKTFCKLHQNTVILTSVTGTSVIRQHFAVGIKWTANVNSLKQSTH